MNLLELFSDSKNTRRFAAGETVFREGEAADVMYVVTKGEVGITLEGKEVESVPASGIFGEMALIDNRPRSATARATTDCELVPIDQQWFSFLVRKNPSFAIHVMSIMADRLRRFMKVSA